ncbi:pseudaminic acid cytidylyltransferase [Asticcacaulis sp. BYS171W]|uniref:Pseudaminic acid cytidylyltransferase n=1 Tax=Asticcacaulis aquaticus TaxID=2984212 RepID=A0ABT5HSC9_9CAUL|nr:pseudaminic acid cytidylyltransferase [Asticcacaulis aquaticus]MDC7682745.1 pseudaminic acid cytidylyltransferase [Asticcacaulis aquaticus]
MRRVCIIPARGGSKRIPRKNIKPFFGQPMIAYSIRAAIETDLFDHVIVSTDDAEIAGVARSFGAETPFVRPSELSNDQAGTGAVMIHAANWLTEQGERPDALCCVYATAPFLTAERLIEGWQALQGKRFAFSVTSYAFPIQRALYRTPDGGVAMFQPEHLSTRSQDLVEAYHDAAQFYWSWTEATLAGESVFSPDAAPVILPRTEVVDIDTPEDWAVAEQLYAATRHKS